MNIALPLAALSETLVAPPRAHEPFSFLFLTDTHIEPELNADQGCRAAFAHARAIGGDFAIHGGDHVFDALGVAGPRAADLAGLYARAEQDLGMTVHHTIGNHDCFGVYIKSGISPDDPLYGKKFFEDHFGRLYYSFDHRGVHFVVLDSIGITPDRDYEGRIDAGQLRWLEQDLAALPPGAPVIVVSHIPLVTAYASLVDAADRYGKASAKISVANTADVLKLLRPHNVLGVLQGHNHIDEVVSMHGIPFITGGAVCGNWWHGTRMGTPEGFVVATVADNRLTTRYEPYGFHSIDPHNT